MAEPRRHAAHAPRRSRRGAILLVVACLALVVVLFAFVYPTRTFLAQRKEVTAAERRLEVLERSTKALRDDNARLQTDAEVERRAREDFGLVRPGETPYVLVPAPPPTTWVP